MLADTSLDIALRHLDAMLERLGEAGVAIGSDYDGAVVPSELGDVSKLPALWEKLRAAGYGETLIARIARENWLDLLERTWKA
jgi:membrane dipeptidase